MRRVIVWPTMKPIIRPTMARMGKANRMPTCSASTGSFRGDSPAVGMEGSAKDSGSDLVIIASRKNLCIYGNFYSFTCGGAEGSGGIGGIGGVDRVDVSDGTTMGGTCGVDDIGGAGGVA